MKKTGLFLFLSLLLTCTSSVHPADLRKSEVGDRRWRAARLIGAERMSRMTPALIQALQSDPVPLVRAQSAVALGQIGKRNKKIYSALTSALKNDPDPLVQQDVLMAMSKLGYERAAPLVEKKLSGSPEPDVRASAAQALQKLGNQKTYPSLLKGLDDQNFRVRSACYRTLKSLTGLNGPLRKSWWSEKLSSPGNTESSS